MKEIKLFQRNQSLGDVKILMRIDGKIIYFKTNNNQYSEQMLQQLSSKGAIIVRGRSWIRINIFKPDLEFVKLGKWEINVLEDSNKEIENKLASFYIEKYIEAGFSLG